MPKLNLDRLAEVNDLMLFAIDYRDIGLCDDLRLVGLSALTVLS